MLHQNHPKVLVVGHDEQTSERFAGEPTVPDATTARDGQEKKLMDRSQVRCRQNRTIVVPVSFPERRRATYPLIRTLMMSRATQTPSLIMYAST
jgi:hypothetical protein